MANVYANALEISGKAVTAQTIAHFPDVCFTPPQTPATPPGVPIPYPSFGMASDTENGTSTVFIGGKTVNIKNKSDESKTSGTEAGCAPKKGIITSKNTGKKYFKSWSPDVKFDGEPVIRFSDLATHNHGSDPPNPPPGPEICKGNPAKFKCEKLGIQPYDELECPEGYIKEHTIEVQFFTAEGVRDLTLPCCQKYDEQKAPCICMKGNWIAGEKAKVKAKKFPRSSGKGNIDFSKGFIGKSGGTPHYYKSADARNWISDNPSGKLGDFKDVCIKSTVKNLGITPGFEAAVTECLDKANMKYLKESTGKKEKDIKDKKACHSTCDHAKHQAQLVKQAKKALRATTPKGKTVVVRAADCKKSHKPCT